MRKHGLASLPILSYTENIQGGKTNFHSFSKLAKKVLLSFRDFNSGWPGIHGFDAEKKFHDWLIEAYLNILISVSINFKHKG